MTTLLILAEFNRYWVLIYIYFGINNHSWMPKKVHNINDYIAISIPDFDSRFQPLLPQQQTFISFYIVCYFFQEWCFILIFQCSKNLINYLISQLSFHLLILRKCGNIRLGHQCPFFWVIFAIILKFCQISAKGTDKICLVFLEHLFQHFCCNNFNPSGPWSTFVRNQQKN